MSATSGRTSLRQFAFYDPDGSCWRTWPDISLWGSGDVLRDLAEAGFDAEWCLLRASDVGACHQRARLFIVAADADDRGWERWRQGEPSAAGSGREGRERRAAGAGQDTPADAHRDGLTGQQGPPARWDALRADLGSDTDRRGDVAWGAYEPAIRRHERAFGRPAPRPVDDAGRLSPAFVEWMMGYPEGWVDGLSRTQALKALGNAVVPQQGFAALSELVPGHLEREVVA